MTVKTAGLNLTRTETFSFGRDDFHLLMRRTHPHSTLMRWHAACSPGSPVNSDLYHTKGGDMRRSDSTTDLAASSFSLAAAAQALLIILALGACFPPRFHMNRRHLLCCAALLTALALVPLNAAAGTITVACSTFAGGHSFTCAQYNGSDPLTEIALDIGMSGNAVGFITNTAAYPAVHSPSPAPWP